LRFTPDGAAGETQVKIVFEKTFEQQVAAFKVAASGDVAKKPS
jgi:hypothetical protein